MTKLEEKIDKYLNVSNYLNEGQIEIQHTKLGWVIIVGENLRKITSFKVNIESVPGGWGAEEKFKNVYKFINDYGVDKFLNKVKKQISTKSNNLVRLRVDKINDKQISFSEYDYGEFKFSIKR